MQVQAISYGKYNPLAVTIACVKFKKCYRCLPPRPLKGLQEADAEMFWG